MAIEAEIEMILALERVSSPETWPQEYRAHSLPWIPDFGLKRLSHASIYGGQVIGQSIYAASLSFPLDSSATFKVHSSHGYFLRPGQPHTAIQYKVHEVRTGQNYSVRRVEAIQFSKAIYTCLCSFKTGLTHALSSSDEVFHETPPPLDLPSRIEDLPPCPDVDLPQMEGIFSSTKMPLDIRKLDLRIENAFRVVNERRQLHFISPRQTLRCRSHNMMAATLAYASDRNLLFTSTNAHLVDEELVWGKLTSLDHSIIFHSLLEQCDGRTKQDTTINSLSKMDWYVFETDSPHSGNKRATMTGKMWNAQGRHVMTVSQEALVEVSKL